MRVLTVRQPWAHAIIHLGKDVENRTRNIAGRYRGPVAIHAGMSADLDAFEAVARVLGDRFAEFAPVSGAIIGVVDLVGVHVGGAWTEDCFQIGAPVRMEWCSPWADRDAYHLQLANPRPLREPIEWKGALGLRVLSPEDEWVIREGLR